MFAGNVFPEKKLEFNFVNDPDFKIDKRGIFQLSLAPHHGSHLSEKETYSTVKTGCDIRYVDCICANSSFSQIFDKLNERANSRMVLIDPIGMPLICISSILSEWRIYSSRSGSNIALGLILRQSDKALRGGDSFYLWRSSNFIEPATLKDTNLLWLASVAIPENILINQGSKLEPYDVYPLVDFTNDRFFISSGVLNAILFLESFRTRTRNFIYLDVDRPDFIFERLSTTISSLAKSKFSVLEPIVSPGGNPSSFIAEVAAAVLNGARLYADKDFVPFSSNMKLKGYIVLRNRS